MSTPAPARPSRPPAARFAVGPIVRATKRRARGRVAIVGPSNAGKTTLALETALQLGPRVILIDTEHESASKYADRYEFHTLALDDHHPDAYCAALDAAEAWRDEDGTPADVVVIDSLSHAWERVQQLVDDAAARSKSGNSFQAWGSVGTPTWSRLIERILASRLHVIATARAKTEYVIDEVNGKKTPRKIGTAPRLRDGAEYEFDVVLELDIEHTCWANKTRCPDLDGHVWKCPRGEIGEILRGWLSDGAPPAERRTAAPQTPAPPAPAEQVRMITDDQAAVLETLLREDPGRDFAYRRIHEHYRIPCPNGGVAHLTQEQAARSIKFLLERQRKREAGPTGPALVRGSDLPAPTTAAAPTHNQSTTTAATPAA